MESLLLVAAIIGIAVGGAIPTRCFMPALCIFGLMLIFGLSALGWIFWAPRDYLFWSDNRVYQTIMHPWILALIGIPIAMTSGALLFGLTIRAGIHKLQKCGLSQST